FAGLLAAFFFLPLPVSRIHDTGLVVLDPGSADPVTLYEPARLVQLDVSPGQTVRKGQVLARFRSENLEVELKKAENARGEQQQYAEEWDRQARGARGRVPDETLEQLNQQADEAREKARTAENEMRLLTDRLNRLKELRAPRDGVLVTCPR